MLQAPVFAAAKRFARFLFASLLFASVIFASGCGRRRAVRTPAPPAPIGATETGVASWYGVPFDGRRTASGEIYDMRQLTAAHQTLPFQTWVNVTNLGNGKQVDVRITDRGPFVGGRIIDLSFAAATEIDMVRSGIARVRLKIIAPPPDTGAFAVQAGAFSDRDRAEAFRKSLSFPDTRVVQRGDPPLWHVLVGHALSKEAASSLASQVEKVSGQSLVVSDR